MALARGWGEVSVVVGAGRRGWDGEEEGMECLGSGLVLLGGGRGENVGGLIAVVIVVVSVLVAGVSVKEQADLLQRLELEGRTTWLGRRTVRRLQPLGQNLDLDLTLRALTLQP